MNELKTHKYISTEIVVMQFFIALSFFSLPLSKYMNDIYFTIMIM